MQTGGVRIGELADLSGVTPRMVRYYEEQGLLRSQRTAGGWRDFDASMVERIIMIQHLFAAGLCSATIYELLPCLEAPPEERTDEIDRLLAAQIERLEQRRQDIERELETLRALRADTRLEA